MEALAVAGQDPLEAMAEQALHRPDLLVPGIPAGIAEADQLPAALGPGQMVAGEEELLAVEQHRMAAGVAGRGDREEVRSEGHRLPSRQLPLDVSRALGH